MENTETQRLTEIVAAAVKQVLVNNTSMCNAPPDMVRQHSDHIAKQEEVNAKILEGIKELKETNEKQYDKINKMSTSITEIRAEKAATKDSSARGISVISVIVAAIAVIISFFKN